MMSTHYCACSLCEAICGLVIEVEDGAVRSIRGDPDDPLSRGHICPKAVALQDVRSDPDRLRQPMRRTAGGGWERVSWDAALDEVADRLAAVRSAHGRDAVAIYLGNPVVHSAGAMLYGPALYRELRTRNRFSATSVDQLAHMVAAHLMFGHQLLMPVPDIDRTDYLLVLGGNPVVSNGSVMTAPGMKRRLRELRARGGRLVVIDPRRTETARIADRHYFIRPGTDALFLLSVLHVLFAERRERPGRLADLTGPLDELRRLVGDFSPESTAAVTRVAADTVREVARGFAGADRAVCYGRLGVSAQEFGGLCQWLVNVLNIVTGNLDRPGGAMFTRPAVDLLKSVGPGHLGRWRSRVRGLPEFAGELPVAALAEEILTAGPGQVRALFTFAGNPVLSTPNGTQLERALPELEFMASVDPYLNETTRHAHVILPPTTALERDHYDLAFNLLAVRNVARYSPAVLPPDPAARHDWQILAGLTRRLAGSTAARARHRLTEACGPRRLLDLGLRSGPYGAGFVPLRRGLTLSRLEKHPHGVDLGALEPCLPERLFTPDRRIRLTPEPLLADLGRLLLTRDRSCDAASLLLIGRRHLRSNNSWLHNSERLTRGPERCTLLMHPADAADLGLADGATVAVTSRVGRVEVTLEVSDEVMEGVVSLPHGWGHHRQGVRLGTAQRRPGASANDLTDDQLTDALSGAAVLNGVPVRVAAS